LKGFDAVVAAMDVPDVQLPQVVDDHVYGQGLVIYYQTTEVFHASGIFKVT
jgi:hypothetical protein